MKGYTTQKINQILDLPRPVIAAKREKPSLPNSKSKNLFRLTNSRMNTQPKSQEYIPRHPQNDLVVIPKNNMTDNVIETFRTNNQYSNHGNIHNEHNPTYSYDGPIAKIDLIDKHSGYSQDEEFQEFDKKYILKNELYNLDPNLHIGSTSMNFEKKTATTKIRDSQNKIENIRYIRISSEDLKEKQNFSKNTEQLEKIINKQRNKKLRQNAAYIHMMLMESGANFKK
jgi:hypothetical protein